MPVLVLIPHRLLGSALRPAGHDRFWICGRPIRRREDHPRRLDSITPRPARRSRSARPGACLPTRSPAGACRRPRHRTPPASRCLTASRWAAIASFATAPAFTSIWMRSATLKPASLRATWTRRMKSRASPSRSSAGIDRRVEHDHAGRAVEARRVEALPRPGSAARTRPASMRWPATSTAPPSSALPRPAFAAARTSFIAAPRRLPTRRGLTDQHFGAELRRVVGEDDLLDVGLVGDDLAQRLEHRVARMRDGQLAERQAVAEVLRRADRGRRRADLAGEVHALDQRRDRPRTPTHPASPADARSRRRPARGGCAR